jgi:hypothetical protein
MLKPRLVGPSRPATRRPAPAAVTAVFFLAASLASAEPLKIKSLRGSVEIQSASGASPQWRPARAGATLQAGDAVGTGDAGRAELVMSDGTKIFLRPKSRLRVTETAPHRVFGMDFGRVKAFVKRAKLRRFEVKTPLAAASVRGTVFEIGYDPGTDSGFLDVTKGSVALQQDGREVLVPGGSRVDFLSGRPLGEPAPSDAGAGAGDADARAEVRREVGLGMSKEQVMAAAAEEMRLAEYQEGKTLVDVHGRRVRLEEYIIRRPREVAEADRDKAFKLVVLNERDDRFDYFYYRGLFNAALPEDLSIALRDINGRLGPEAPDYFLREYEMGQSNTRDFIKDNASGGHLVKITYDGTNYVLADPADPSNTETIPVDEQSLVDGVTYHKIYDPINDRFQTVTDAQFQAGDFRPAVYDPSDDGFRLFSSADTYWRTRYNDYSHVINGALKQSYARKPSAPNVLAVDRDADFTYAGGYVLPVVETPSGADLLHNRVTLYYGDGTTEAYDTYIISDEGALAPASAFQNVVSGAAYKAELLKWNYQQVASATEFQGRKIDLVVEPKILIKSGLIK